MISERVEKYSLFLGEVHDRAADVVLEFEEIRLCFLMIKLSGNMALGNTNIPDIFCY